MDNSSGAAGEDRAAAYLTEKGFRILARNYRSRFGEIDIIAEDGKYILFAEVKTRKSSSLVDPAEAVTAAKRTRIAKTALLYLQRHPTGLQPRFDVIAVVVGKNRALEKLEHIENAFDFASFL